MRAKHISLDRSPEARHHDHDGLQTDVGHVIRVDDGHLQFRIVVYFEFTKISLGAVYYEYCVSSSIVVLVPTWEIRLRTET